MEFPIQVRFIPGVGTLRLLLSDRDNVTVGCMAGVSGYQKSIVYTDETQTTPIYAIEWKYGITEYFFATPQGAPLGSVKRTPWRSVWRAHYVITLGDAAAFVIEEENPFVKVLNELAGFIPLADRLSGLFLNPTYAVKRPDGTTVLRLVKERAIYEYHFSVHQVGAIEPREREVALLALLMFVERENRRG